MKRIGLLIVAVAMLLTGKAHAICFTDNISTGSTLDNYDWTSPDGTGHGTFVGAVAIQLHQTCGWVPRGTLTGTMRWFDTGQILPLQITSWSYSRADFRIFEPQQSNWFWFSCGYVRPLLWQCTMQRYDVPSGSWVNNGTLALYR